MKVFRCWWCLEFLTDRGRDCHRKECINGIPGKYPGRRSGPWKKRKRRNSLNKKPQPEVYTQ